MAWSQKALQNRTVQFSRDSKLLAHVPARFILTTRFSAMAYNGANQTHTTPPSVPYWRGGLGGVTCELGSAGRRESLSSCDMFRRKSYSYCLNSSASPELQLQFLSFLFMFINPILRSTLQLSRLLRTAVETVGVAFSSEHVARAQAFSPASRAKLRVLYIIRHFRGS